MSISNVFKRDEILFLLFWCSGYIGAKIGVPLSGTFTLLFYRYIIVVLIAAVIISLRSEWRKPDSNSFLLGFFAHFVWLVVILKSFEYGMNAGAVALIASGQPILTAFIAPFFLGEKNNALIWLGILAGFFGVMVFVSADASFTNTSLWVYLLPFAATLSLTFVTLWGRKYTQTKQSPPIMTSLFWQGLLTLALLTPLAFFFEGYEAQWGGAFIFSVIWLGIVVSVLAYAMMFYLIRTREAARVSALQYFVPPVTMLIAWIIFREELSLLGFVGLFITSAGFYLMHKGRNLNA